MVHFTFFRRQQTKILDNSYSSEQPLKVVAKRYRPQYILQSDPSDENTYVHLTLFLMFLPILGRN
jgi:hypothetical protein